ncbi:hypothetical protein [Candidatus Protofrankia californiensis]|uniref:hypothetical protein n=1 Tax=Candidatus Protofrankia californiensis TaxID=1839754 RepID=UPI0010416037|nr:hypothetical protein [Candidatus Protofrankia californiensis]
MALRLTARKAAGNENTEGHGQDAGGHDQDAGDENAVQQERDQQRDQASDLPETGANPAQASGRTHRAHRQCRARRADGPLRHPRARLVAGRALAGLLVIGLAMCLWQGWRWWAATRSDAAANAAFTADRDAAMTAGQDGMIVFNTVDYRRAEENLDGWASASTSPLQEKVRQERTQITKTITDAKTVNTARLIQSGLNTFDHSAGTAKVIVVIEIRSVPDGQPATTERTRLTGDVTRTASGWKLSSIQAVPVGR